MQLRAGRADSARNPALGMHSGLDADHANLALLKSLARCAKKSAQQDGRIASKMFHSKYDSSDLRGSFYQNELYLTIEFNYNKLIRLTFKQYLNMTRYSSSLLTYVY